jgi:hypothetical protein
MRTSTLGATKSPCSPGRNLRTTIAMTKMRAGRASQRRTRGANNQVISSDPSLFAMTARCLASCTLPGVCATFTETKKAGEPGGNRTLNPQIKSLLLCQLSYRPTETCNRRERNCDLITGRRNSRSSRASRAVSLRRLVLRGLSVSDTLTRLCARSSAG